MSEADEKEGLGRSIQKFFRRLRLRPATDIHRDDLVEGLSDEDNLHADSFNEDEKRFLKNILFLRATFVEDVMVRRAQISAIDVTATLQDVKTAFEKTEHSRLPVYRDTLDSPLGFLHIKDVFKCLLQNKTEFSLEKMMHSALFVPPSMKVADLLNKMQAQKIHMALVIDEHGGTNGLVTIEDLVEEIVGEIEDEHPKEPSQGKRNFVRRRDGSFEIKADASLEEVEKLIGRNVAEDKLHAQTIGGFAVSLFGKVPEKGERVKTDKGITIEVRSVDLRRVHQVRIYVG